MSSSLSPQEFWETTGIEKGMDALNNSAITALGDCIMGRGVMDSELLCCPFLFQVQNKCLVQVLPPSDQNEES